MIAHRSSSPPERDTGSTPTGVQVVVPCTFAIIDHDLLLWRQYGSTLAIDMLMDHASFSNTQSLPIRL